MDQEAFVRNFLAFGPKMSCFLIFKIYRCVSFAGSQPMWRLSTRRDDRWARLLLKNKFEHVCFHDLRAQASWATGMANLTTHVWQLSSGTWWPNPRFLRIKECQMKTNAPSRKLRPSSTKCNCRDFFLPNCHCCLLTALIEPPISLSMKWRAR